MVQQLSTARWEGLCQHNSNEVDSEEVGFKQLCVHEREREEEAVDKINFLFYYLIDVGLSYWQC